MEPARPPKPAIALPAPIIEMYGGDIAVVREDLLGDGAGSKLRYFVELFRRHEHVVYATPAQGGAQLALAHAARLTGGRATLFVAKRSEPHPRTLESKRVGATVYQVPHGYLNVVQARAREYAADERALLLPFGGDTGDAHRILRTAAGYVHEELLRRGFVAGEIWSAAGSGTLTRALQAAWPVADVYAVQVGRDLGSAGGRATVVAHPLDFDDRSDAVCPFPSDPHYDRKAWEVCITTYRLADHKPRIVFWNVLGDLAPTQE